MPRSFRSLAAVASILLTPASPAQERPGRLHFDVIAIHENRNAGGWNAGMSLRDGTLQVNNLFLKSLITSAYGVREVLIFGLPVWAEEAHYDIRAKVADADAKTIDNANREQRRALMAAMLEDRFHLRVHTATKTLPVYDLVVASGGLKLHESVGAGKETDVRKTEFTAAGATMLTLSYVLEDVVERTVVDKTGLTGAYDLHLQWAPDGTVAVDANALPSIFTALQEQFGLKLQADKGPVKTLVVDHIERPSEN